MQSLPRYAEFDFLFQINQNMYAVFRLFYNCLFFFELMRDTNHVGHHLSLLVVAHLSDFIKQFKRFRQEPKDVDS